MIFHRRPSTYLAKIKKEIANLMADIANLNAAVSKLQTDVDAAVSKIQNQTPTQAEVDAVTANITAASTSLENAVTPPPAA